MISTVRKLPPESSPRPGDGVLKAVNDSDKNISGWFEQVQLTRKSDPEVVQTTFKLTNPADFLDQRQAAQFDPDDSRSLDLKYCAKILQPQACYS